MTNLWRGLRLTVVLAVLCGFLYPLLLVGVGSVALPFQATGSMMVRHGRIVGSYLIAQAVSSPALFHPRPSAVNYDADNSGGSNLGPTNPALLQAVRRSLEQVERQNPGTPVKDIPPSMVESSGSGLDPDITLADAHIQVARVARASGLSPALLDRLIRQNTVRPALGIWGQSMVNVNQLNLAVLALLPTSAPQP